MRRQLRKWLPATVPMFLLPSVAVPAAWAQPKPITHSFSRTDGLKPEAPPSAEQKPAYRIGIGDILHIAVWQEPQLAETAVVRPDGKISMPLVTDVAIAGLTTDAAENVLTQRLEQFVRKPVVTVVVQEIRSRTVYVTGEVLRPGAYPLIDTMNVVQLVARAGGLTDFAKKTQVYVLRASNGARLNVNYRKILKGQSPQENVQLSPGDTVVVP